MKAIQKLVSLTSHMMLIRSSNHTGNGRSQQSSLQGKNRCNPGALCFWPYKKKNEIERFLARLKQFRVIATRYDKLKSTFLAAVQPVATVTAIN